MSATPLSWLALEGIKDDSGAALASGELFFFVAGTSTQTPVYGDAAKTQVLSQPVVADAYGRTLVFTDGPVRIAAFNSSGVAITPIDAFNAKKDSEIVIESVAFTGLLPSGSQGLGGKTNTATIFNRAVDSFGGPDWKYLPAAGLTPRYIQTVLRERGLSVKDCGAVGDGIVVDTGAFTSALAILQAAGGGKLYVPPGTYIVDSELLWTFDGLTIEGAGQGVSIIKQTSTSANGFKTNAGDSFSMRDLTVKASTLSTGSGLDIFNATKCYIERCQFQNFQNGIKVEDAASDSSIRDCDFTVPYDAGTHPLANGVFVTDSANGTRIRDCRITGGTTGCRGVHLSSNPTHTIISGTFFNTLNIGLSVAAATGGGGIWLTDSKLSSCTKAIAIATTNLQRFTARDNYYGAALITDVSILPDLASATELAPTGPGVFTVSGTTQIDNIKIMPAGTHITLIFTNASPPQVTDNVASTATAYIIQLVGGTWASPTQNDVLELVCTGTSWYETNRAAI